jgi:tRNA(fMet)-specific endonuclease VapC
MAASESIRVTGDAILDTSAAVAHLRGVAAVTARLRAKLAAQETVYLPLTAWGELLYGAYHSSRPARELANLAAFALGTVRLLPTDRTADEYARLKQALAAAGSPIPENDIWIAAHALEQGLPLITRDAHFANVTGLSVQDWS